MEALFMVQRITKLLLIGLFLSAPAWATDYYVATTGNDSDPGTGGQPFLTIQKGVTSAINPDDRVLVNDGTYTTGFSQGVANISLAHNGSTEATKNITGITQANPCVLTVTLNGYSNGDIIAIYGLDDYKINGMEQLSENWFKVANAATNSFSLTDLDGNAINSTSFDPYVTGGTVQRIHPITIKAINRGNVTIDTSTIISGWSNSGQPANTYLSSIAGGAVGGGNLWKVGRNTLLSKQTGPGSVTSESTYYYNSATDKYLIYTTSNPNLSTYKATNTSEVRYYGAQWNLLDGIVGQYGYIPILVGYGSGFPTPPGQGAFGPTSNNLVRYCTAQYGVQWGMAVQTCAVNKSWHNKFDHVTIQYIDEDSGGQNGHCFKCAANNNADDGRYADISNSTVHDCRYHGIQSSNAWSHNSFFGNRVYNVSLRGSGSGADIRCGYSGSSEPSDCHVFGNDLGGGSGGTGSSIATGIYLQDTDINAEIFRNNIHDHIWHGIYIFYSGTGPTGPSNALIFDNLIWNNGSSGIKVDSSDSVKIYNNSFYNNAEMVLYGAGAAIDLNNNLATNVAIENNIIQTSTASSIYTNVSYTLYPSNYNDLYRSSGFKVVWAGTTYNSLAAYSAATTGITPGGLDQNSVTGDPLFDAPASGSFQIPSPDTPADAAGVDLSTVIPTDYLVATRQIPFDIGAYNTNGNLIIQASVTPTSLFPTRVTTDTVAFRTSALTINKDWKIKVTYPTGFTPNSGGTTGITTVSGFDGTWTVSVSGQTVTHTRNNDGTNTAPASYSFVDTFMQNPGTSGYTAKFQIQVTDSSDVQQGNNSNVPAVIISDVAPGTISDLVFNGGTLN